MKALSIRQPWAWLIVNDYKNIENRSWPTKYRGTFLIHASLKFDFEGLRYIRGRFPGAFKRLPTIYTYGAIVGAASLVDCVTEHRSRWFAGENYGFVLANAHTIESIPFKGKLGFFETGYDQSGLPE